MARNARSAILSYLTPHRDSRALWVAGLIPALLVGLLVVGLFQLETPHAWTGDHWQRYLRYRRFWGGNPSEVFSHWLNMVLMSGNAGVLSVSIGVQATLRRRHPWVDRVTGAAVALGFVVSASAAAWLDTRYGEGVAPLLYPVGFAPVLFASYVLLQRIAVVLRWRPLPVLGVCLSHAVLQVTAQYYYERSVTGGPNGYFWPIWIGSLIVLAAKGPGLLIHLERKARLGR